MSSHFDAFTAHQQARQQAKMAEYQAKVSDYNASVSEQNKRTMLARGAEDINRQNVAFKQELGEMRGAIAESGIFGQSAINLLKESMVNMELDRQTMRASIMQEAENIDQQTADLRRQAELSRYEGRQYKQQARQILARHAIEQGEKAVTASAGGGFSKGANGANIPIKPQGRGTQGQWRNPDTGKTMRIR